MVHGRTPLLSRPDTRHGESVAVLDLAELPRLNLARLFFFFTAKRVNFVFFLLLLLLLCLKHVRISTHLGHVWSGNSYCTVDKPLMTRANTERRWYFPSSAYIGGGGEEEGGGGECELVVSLCFHQTQGLPRRRANFKMDHLHSTLLLLAQHVSVYS